MKTARDILAQHIMWAKADWTKDNHAQADEATTALEVAGYVIVGKSDQAFVEGLVGWRRMREMAARLADDRDQTALGEAIRALELEPPAKP